MRLEEIGSPMLPMAPSTSAVASSGSVVCPSRTPGARGKMAARARQQRFSWNETSKVGRESLPKADTYCKMILQILYKLKSPVQ